MAAETGVSQLVVRLHAWASGKKILYERLALEKAELGFSGLTHEYLAKAKAYEELAREILAAESDQ